MRRFWQKLTTPVIEEDILTRLQLRFIMAVSLATALIGGVGVMFQLPSGNYLSGAMIGSVLALIGNIALFRLAQYYYLTASAIILIITLTLTALVTPPVVFLVVGPVALIAAAALSPRPLFLLTTIIIVIRHLLDMFHLSPVEHAPTAELSFTESASLLVLLVIVSLTVRYFIYVAQYSLANATRNTRLLRGIADVGQILSTLRNTDEILERAVTLIQDRFGFYHVQVFLLDDTHEYAVLHTSTGEVGRELLARRHRLAVGSSSVVGQAAGAKVVVLARDTAADRVHRFNELLPDTRSELAIPILENEQIVGILDVQSTQRQAFLSEDIQALQTMANLIGTAMSNARLFEEQARSVKEQQRLFLESEANLREIRRLNQQLTKEGWTSYVTQAQSVMGVTLENNRMVDDHNWTDALAQASYYRRAVVSAGNGRPGTVAVPVTLRGEVIGAIEVEPGDDIEQKDTVEMLTAVAERLAVSLENARLFEESRAATVQEQRINDIVSRYQEVTDVDDLLRITLQELSESLGAQQGAIRLGMIPRERDDEEASVS